MNILTELGKVCDEVYSVRGEIRLSILLKNEAKVWAVLEAYNTINPHCMYGVAMRTEDKASGLVEMRLI